MTKVTKNVRGPSIARETARGKRTAYAVCKEIWSHRGPIVNTIAKLGFVGEIKKGTAVAILADLPKEAAAPFAVKKVGSTLNLVAA